MNKTTKRFPPFTKSKNPETYDTTASSSTAPLSFFLQSRTHSTASCSRNLVLPEDTDNTYVAPAQKKTKTPQQTKTHFHKTNTYAGILNGNFPTVNKDAQSQEELAGADADTAQL